ncbi:hypothetical protein LTR09_010396 [Extremus antarcticus]|uniref:NmrA-like domain-containing protein n=1 Tax=Extremus antarcticus TaxID=702011 RepID=A0AAJ0G8N2_9PEZI|nr:hypothetical protein LTR09_010396 [Extremus antarcticus]
MPSQTPIKNVVVLGATGNIGLPIVKALVNHRNHYSVTAVTRNAAKSKSLFPPQVKVAESDLSPSSLRTLFQDQDAVVSCVTSNSIATQKSIIDVALESGIRRFIPSEFGMDSGNPAAADLIPLIATKVPLTEYLKANQDQMSWTAIITGMFFDWALRNPFPLAYDIPNRKAVVYDSGEYEHECTNIDKIGEAVAALLSPEHEEETANEFVYVNSFTATQNKVVAAIEEAMGEKMEVTRDTSLGLRERMLGAREKDPNDPITGLGLIVASFFGVGGLNEYSKNTKSRLWNVRLGLREEFLEETVREEVAKWKKGAGENDSMSRSNRKPGQAE